MMMPDKAQASSILAANAKLLAAFLAATLAWLMWPNSLEWWGFGVLSGLFALVAIRKFFEAVVTIRQINARSRAISTLTQDTIEPKSSSLVSREDLRKAGMIE